MPTFLGIYAVAAVPWVAVSTPLMMRSLTVAPGTGEPGELLRTALLGGLLFVGYTTLLAPVATGAMTIAVSERYLGRPASLLGAYRRVARRVGPLIGSLTIVTIPLLGALLAAMVGVFLAAMLMARWLGLDAGDPAQTTILATLLWVPVVSALMVGFTTLFGFIPAAVVLEGRGLGSIWRSLALAWGDLRRVFGLFAVLLWMVILAAAYLRLPSQVLSGAAGMGDGGASAWLGALAMQLGVLLVDPVRMVGITLTYYDQRIRREGFDLALLADELGGAEKGGT